MLVRYGEGSNVEVEKIYPAPQQKAATYVRLFGRQNRPASEVTANTKSNKSVNQIVDQFSESRSIVVKITGSQVRHTERT